MDKALYPLQLWFESSLEIIKKHLIRELVDIDTNRCNLLKNCTPKLIQKADSCIDKHFVVQ
jgi:hypothetical protein